MQTPAVTHSSFDKRVLIEQVRYIESNMQFALDTEEVARELPEHGNFDDRLWHRARHIVEHYELRTSMAHAAWLTRYTGILAGIIAAILGVAGTAYAITGNNTINIYWLLLVLLGFNLLSMSLWVVGISLNLERLIGGILARLTHWLPGLIENKHKSITQAADRAWVACHYGGSVGKWQLSKITHQLWLTYLVAGLAVLILLLMAQQYDFVWGTTLLSDTTFVKLTDTLSTPLQALGFNTPSADQVQHTRIGTMETLSAAERYSWAQFLIGALLCYGIVPRIVLWGWSILMRNVARRRFVLDYYLPYYIHLRQQLMPLAGHGQIVDADTSPPADFRRPAMTPTAHTLPPETKWVAVEIGDDLRWPPTTIQSGADLGQVTDRESLTRTRQRLQDNPDPVIAVAVAATRSPDRGVQRTIASLMSDSQQRWLVLLQHVGQEPVSGTRLAAWYRLAETCKVPADHVISLTVD